MANTTTERGKTKIKFGTETFHSSQPDEVPLVQLEPLSEEVVGSYSGPDSGLAFVDSGDENNGNEREIAGCWDWNKKEQQAYGICISLYEQHPLNGKMSGDPIADAFAVCARKNNTILLIADGVNWGEKSRLAARCALHGSMKYINKRLFNDKRPIASTQDAMKVLRRSFDEAHRTILAKEGGLTTMCACLVCPVSNSDQYAVCCVNVGDSYAFVFSHNNGIREVTVGSHDVKSERDIRDAGGALGPVDGKNPELHNLTCSLTFSNVGDIVFLTTDGVSDNFDPVVTKIALPKKPPGESIENNPEADPYILMHSKPEMSPRERHIYSMKEMERIVHEYELVMEEEVSAQELCGAMVQHILTLTDSKRKILENPALYARRKMTSTERRRRDSEIVEKMSKAPGKLDHASIVAVEVGAFLPKEVEEEDVNSDVVVDNRTATSANANTISLNTLTLPGSGGPKSPTSPSARKSGARRFFSRLKNLPSPTSPSPSRTSPIPFPVSPRKEAKRQIKRMTSNPATPQSPTIPESPFESPCELSPSSSHFPSHGLSPSNSSPSYSPHELSPSVNSQSFSREGLSSSNDSPSYSQHELSPSYSSPSELPPCRDSATTCSPDPTAGSVYSLESRSEYRCPLRRSLSLQSSPADVSYDSFPPRYVYIPRKRRSPAHRTTHANVVYTPVYRRIVSFESNV